MQSLSSTFINPGITDHNWCRFLCRCFMEYLCLASTYQELKNNWHIQIVPGGINHKSSVMKTGIVINMSPIGKILQSKWITQYSRYVITPNNWLNIYLPSIYQRLKYFELRHNQKWMNEWVSESVNKLVNEWELAVCSDINMHRVLPLCNIWLLLPDWIGISKCFFFQDD